MYRVLIYLVLSGISSSYSLKIDPSSIHTLPDLYRLCWRQNDERKIDLLRVYISGSPKNLLVFQEKDEKDNTKYCVEEIGETRSLEIEFPLAQNREDGYFRIMIQFSMLLAPPFQIIRKKVVPTGVHLKLLNEYAGIPSNITSRCVVILEYEAKGKKKYNVIQMTSNSNSEYFHSLNPGTPFSIYYSCYLVNFLQYYSVFIVENGEIFPTESTNLINPFIQFPFRRFLVAQWKHPSNIPNSYSISIYEVRNKISKCLKIFRLFKSSIANASDGEMSSLSHGECGSNVAVEDLGFYDHIANGIVYVVLDMFTFLRPSTLHKFSILWFDRQWRTKKNDFIYFESWPNEKCGLVNPNIFNYESNRYEFYRNMTSDIRQNVFCYYHEPFYEGSSFNIFRKRSSIVPVLSSYKPLFESRNTLNYSIVKQMMNSNSYCWKTFYPFCYLIIEDTSKRNVELIEVQKPEDSLTKIKEIKFKAEIGDPGFTISLDLRPESLAQALFIVEIYKDKECVSIYILSCKSCSQRFKKLSEERFEKKINELKQNCKRNVQILENYFQATEKFISFRTKEMPYEENFYPIVYSVNLFSVTSGLSGTPYFLKKSFYQKYGNIFIGFFGSIALILLIVVIAVRCKLVVKTENKEEEKEESNKYYGEDDL